jgi:hypothetical protein
LPATFGATDPPVFANDMSKSVQVPSTRIRVGLGVISEVNDAPSVFAVVSENCVVKLGTSTGFPEDFASASAAATGSVAGGAASAVSCATTS